MILWKRRTATEEVVDRINHAIRNDGLVLTILRRDDGIVAHGQIQQRRIGAEGPSLDGVLEALGHAIDGSDRATSSHNVIDFAAAREQRRPRLTPA